MQVRGRRIVDCVGATLTPVSLAVYDVSDKTPPTVAWKWR